jgi:hypothetical protein
MRDTGRRTRLTVMVDLSMLMVTAITEIGSTTKPTVVELMSIWTEPNTSATGKRINSTAMVSKHGRITQNMKETTNMVRNMESAPSSGLTVQLTPANSITIISMAKVCTPGTTIENTKATGEPIKCTEREPSHGPMEENISASIPKTKRKVMASSFGLTVDAIVENGSTENNTAKEPTSPAMAKRSTVNGKKAKESDGSAEEKWTDLLFS